MTSAERCPRRAVGGRPHAALTGLLLGLLVGAALPATAGAQWQTDEPGLWGARRCHARNLISGGILLGATGLAQLEREDRAAVGVSLLAGGVAVTATGIGLRVRLRRDPGGTGPHDAWPEERCQARALSIRGALTLSTAIVALVRLLRASDQLPDRRSRGVVALLTVVPPGVIGVVFLAVGLRRVRTLGQRPPADAGAPAALTVAYPFRF